MLKNPVGQFDKNSRGKRRTTKCPNCEEGYLMSLVGQRFMTTIKDQVKTTKTEYVNPRLAYCPDCDSIYRILFLEVKREDLIAVE